MPRPPPTSRYSRPAPAFFNSVKTRAASLSARDDADVGDLAAKMEVQQLEAVFHAARAQFLETSQHLCHGETELRAVAA